MIKPVVSHRSKISTYYDMFGTHFLNLTDGYRMYDAFSVLTLIDLNAYFIFV